MSKITGGRCYLMKKIILIKLKILLNSDQLGALHQISGISFVHGKTNTTHYYSVNRCELTINFRGKFKTLSNIYDSFLVEIVNSLIADDRQGRIQKLFQTNLN